MYERKNNLCQGADNKSILFSVVIMSMSFLNCQSFLLEKKCRLIIHLIKSKQDKMLPLINRHINILRKGHCLFFVFEVVNVMKK